MTGGVAAAAAYSHYSTDLPSPDRLQNRQMFRSTKILDRQGRLLYELFDPQAGKRTSVKLSEVSQHVIQATIAIEDSTFYENLGFSPRAIARAALYNLQGEEITQGGSTITQQLIKQVLLTSEVTVDRKIREVLLAIQVNQVYSKDQIMEWYLNENNYGNMSYGIQAAAESYFGKSASELDLAEASMLAGIPQSPSLLSPVVDSSAAKRRQRMVLDAMVRERMISEEQADAAFKKPLDFQPMKFGIEAPHFVMYIRSLLEQKFSPRVLYSGGLVVTTTLDLDMQHVAERIARAQVDKLKKSNIYNAALVALKPETGEIMAMLGSVDYFNQSISGQVNIATSERQPGSTFKPITYAATFLKGWSPSTVLLDAYTVFRDRSKRPYTPSNVDKKWHGPVTIRTALGNSMNIPAVKAVEYAGVENTVALAHRMGITSLDPSEPWDLSVTLGGGEVKLLDLAFAYAVFANNGVMAGQQVAADAQREGYRVLEPVAILRVEDADGKVLEEYSSPQKLEVLKPQVAYQVTNVLTDNRARMPLFAPDNPLKLSRPAAAKTGTTENYRDLWTVGYTPDLVTAVWVGNSDNREIADALTTGTAGPIWHDFMEEVLAGTSARDFDQPEGLERAEVCSLTGLKPSANCPTKYTDIFVKGTVPTKVCDVHRVVEVDKTSGHLADLATPPENRARKVVEVFPAEWAEWARAAGRGGMPKAAEVVPTTEPAKPAEARDDNSSLVLATPLANSAVRGAVDIMGTAAGKAFASYKLEVGEGASPSSWRALGAVRSAPVENGILERWDTKGLQGLYKIRLTLNEKPTPAPASPTPGASLAPTSPPAGAPAAPGATKVIDVAVVVDNSPPKVSIVSPKDNETIDAGRTEKLLVGIELADNHRMAGTDLYVDDQLVGSAATSPWDVEWTPSQGSHTLRAVGKDAAGNESSSNLVKIVVR